MGIESRLGPGNYRRIAKSAQLVPQHVSRVLKAQKGCSLEVAARIARAAGVSIDAMYAFIASHPHYRNRGRRTRAELTDNSGRAA